MDEPSPKSHAREVHRYLAKLLAALLVAIAVMVVAIVLSWRAWGPEDEPEVVPSFIHGQPPRAKPKG